MNLPVIEMPEQVAREAFADYRRAVRERHTAEDQQLMRAYRELAKGRRLINLTDAIKAGGTTELPVRASLWRDGAYVTDDVDVTLPRLAVTRAHQTACWTTGIGERGVVELRGRQELGHTNVRDRIVVRGFDPGQYDPDGRSWAPRIVAQAPLIPPPFRPAHRLENYHLLWEAEWALSPKPPVDPALLKRIGGDLYAVIAVWDLTEIERAVLAGRDVE